MCYRLRLMQCLFSFCYNSFEHVPVCPRMFSLQNTAFTFKIHFDQFGPRYFWFGSNFFSLCAWLVRNCIDNSFPDENTCLYLICNLQMLVWHSSFPAQQWRPNLPTLSIYLHARRTCTSRGQRVPMEMYAFFSNFQIQHNKWLYRWLTHERVRTKNIVHLLSNGRLLKKWLPKKVIRLVLNSVLFSFL